MTPKRPSPPLWSIAVLLLSALCSAGSAQTPLLRPNVGLRVGSLLPRTELEGQPGLHLEAFGRYPLRPRLDAELGLGYARMITRDTFGGQTANFSTDLALADARLLWQALAGSAFASRHPAWRPQLYAGIGLLRYDIADLTARRGRVAPIGWSLRIPIGLGVQHPLEGGTALELAAGYTFTFSDALNEVEDGGANDGYFSLTVGLAFGQPPRPLPLVQRDLQGTLQTPQLSSLDKADRDGDGLSEHDETRVYFTNPLMADSDGDGVSDGDEVLRLGTDPNRAERAAAPRDVPDRPPPLPTETVSFCAGGAALDADAERILDQVAARLRQHGGLRLELRGYADSQGPAALNLDLSRQRAAAVRAYLVKAGIAPERLQLKAMGETEPIAPNDTAAGRRRNRRVQLVPLPP